jgi:hypothetical protein
MTDRHSTAARTGSKQQSLPIACHNFTDIRRRPLVIGKLDQVRLPFVITMPQLAIGAITFGLLYLTRPVWGAVMSDRLHIVVFVATPVLVAQQVSRTSVEGRSLSKAAMGLFRLWTAPRYGTINGRRHRPGCSGTLRLQPLLVQPDRRRRRVSGRIGRRRTSRRRTAGRAGSVVGHPLGGGERR